jgi:polar amino acid transport system permease protein
VTIVAENFLYLLRGTGATAALAAGVIVLGTVAGLVVGLLRFVPSALGRAVVTAVVEVIRATPLLLLLFFIFFGLPAIGVRIPTWPAAVLALGLWLMANTAEVVRGAVQSIPRGQTEAARSTGLTTIQALRFVILPQALRRMLPPFVGLCTILIKDTSLAAIIGVFELTRATQESVERTLHPFELYLTAAAIYFGLCFPLSLVADRAERRLQRP